MRCYSRCVHQILISKGERNRFSLSVCCVSLFLVLFVQAFRCVLLTASYRWLLVLDPAVARRQGKLWTPVLTGDVLKDGKGLKQMYSFVCWLTYLNCDNISSSCAVALSYSWLATLLQENMLTPVTEVVLVLFCFFTAVEGLKIEEGIQWFMKTSPNPSGWTEKFKVINLTWFLESWHGFYLASSLLGGRKQASCCCEWWGKTL